MGNEAKKTAALWDETVWSLLKGRGLDIGAGLDPITTDVQTFDKHQGDANRIDEYIDQEFDFVFSSPLVWAHAGPVSAATSSLGSG